jgi:DNA-binding response OmpR family regulator
MSKYRLLVIEDDPRIADMICRVAKKENFDVRLTCNSIDLTSLYNAFVPQVVVLDIFMPNVDGFEVLNFLHMHKSSTRIVIISGRAEYRLMAARMAKGLKLTIVATVAKPFRIGELRRTLEATKLLLPAAEHSPPLERQEYA